MGLMNTEIQRHPHFTTEKLDCLVADGHQLGCRGLGYHNARTARVARFEGALLRNRECIAALLSDVKLDTFSYPFGRVTVNMKRTVSRYFTRRRGTYSGINCGGLVLNLSRPDRLYSRSVKADRISGLIKGSSDAHEWLIFYVRGASNNPSPVARTEEVLG